jgi:hypothetical protein
LESEVTRLRTDVRLIEELLRSAGTFYSGWARLMSPDQGPPNYTAAGRDLSGTLPNTDRLVVHG